MIKGNLKYFWKDTDVSNSSDRCKQQKNQEAELCSHQRWGGDHVLNFLRQRTMTRPQICLQRRK